MEWALVLAGKFSYNPTVEKSKKSDKYRNLPSVSELLDSAAAQEMLGSYSRASVVDAIRVSVDEARVKIGAGEDAPDADSLLDRARDVLEGGSRQSMHRVINATGVVIHTGLGRAVLCEEAQEAVNAVARSHANLEIEMASGKRGSRQDHVAKLLCELTGAEAALVVNNNAAAVLLGVNTMALGRDVIVSRGQLVEIGGSFRLPEIVERAGARLVEIGTTNRTRLSDYSKALSETSGLILRCHPSNFKVTGFTEEVVLEELVKFGSEAGVCVLDDLGSGALVDVSGYGLENEPTVQDSVSSGADIVTFSGDKLLGGPQAGILVGKADAITACRSNPIARAVRIDKLTLAALEATLRVYLYGDPSASIKTLRAIGRPLREIEAQAGHVAERINAAGVAGLEADVISVGSETGGGSLPGQSLESRAIALKSGVLSAEDLGVRFRGNCPPIFGRIERDRFLLDMRTVEAEEGFEIVNCALSLAQ